MAVLEQSGEGVEPQQRWVWQEGEGQEGEGQWCSLKDLARYM